MSLTREQEKAIINCCIDRDQIGQGASRMVYELAGGVINSACGVEVVSPKHSYIVKIAIGIAGQNQIDNEVTFYLEHQDDIDCPFATIYAAGENVEIMECVDTEVSDSCRAYAKEDEDIFYAGLREQMERMFDTDDATSYMVDAYDTIQRLHNMLGYSSDNGQIGYDWNSNKWVAFDYGYIVDCDRPLCSDASESLDCDGELTNNYLRDLAEKVLGQSMTMEELEQALLDDIYGNNDDEEEEENYDE